VKTRSQKASFIGGTGGALDARLETPVDTPLAYAIASHCFTCSKDTITVFRISRLLAANGIAVLRFDFTGLGNSAGDFAASSFTTDVADVQAAADFLRDNYAAPTLLIGHSLGGTAMLEAAMAIESVKGVVTIASPSQPAHVLHHFGPALSLLEQGIAASIQVAGRDYQIEPAFVEDLRRYDMRERLALLNKPVLIFRVLKDPLVDEANADEIKAWTSGPSTIITLDKADHLLSNKDDAAFVADQIVAWFNNLL
jgi:putative redox protein